MVEESSSSRYKNEKSPSLGRRYGSARYHRATVDLPIRASSPNSSSYQAPSSSRKYQTATSTSDQPFRFTRSPSFDNPSYSRSTRSPVYHDFSSHDVEKHKSTKYSSGYRSPPTARASSPSYSSKYTPTESSVLSTSPPPYHYKDASREESSSRSSSFSSRGSSGSTSRKSSTSSVGRDKNSYVGSISTYSGRTSPDASTSQDISRLTQTISKTFDRESRRGSDSSASPQTTRSPFFRSYSLRSDYTSRYAQHQILGRTKSSPTRSSVTKQASLPEERVVVKTTATDLKEERSRKGSWLQRHSPDHSDKGGLSKVFGGKQQRSGSSSPSEGNTRFSLTGKLSSSNESNTDSGDLLRKKFSVPSKYFSSKETISRESSEGSIEIVHATGTGKLKKKYSLPTKLSLMRKRSTSIEGSRSEPASPDRYQAIARARSVSIDSDPEKDHSRGSVIRRFRFWDKKDRRSPRSRSRSPEGGHSSEEIPTPKPLEQPLVNKENEVNQQNVQVLTDAIKALEETAKSDSVAEPSKTVKVVSKKVDTGDAQARKLSREERRARYRREHGTTYSKSMDAAIGMTTISNEANPEDTTNNNTNTEDDMQTSDKLRERRRQRRLEREKFFASETIVTSDSNKPSRQKLKLSVSTEDSADLKQRSKTICSSAHQDIIESILKDQPHLSREEVRPPSVKEMLKRFICEDDTSKTILDSRKAKDEGRPHTICGGTLSPDEMRKFEDITFSLARKYSSDDSRPVKAVEKDISSSSDVEGKVIPSSTTQTECKAPDENNVEKPQPTSRTEKIIRKLSIKGEDDSPHRTLFRKQKTSAEKEEKDKKEAEKDRLQELEKEKKVREKGEKERKELERQRKEEREEKIKKDKEEKLRKGKEEKLKKEREEKAKKDKIEKEKKEEKAKKEMKEQQKSEKAKIQEEEKEKKVKEKIKDKEKRQQEKKERKERKQKLRDEQKDKTQLHLELLKKRAEVQAEDNEVTSVDGVEKGPTQQEPKNDAEGPSELPREGSVSQLLSLFATADKAEKPRHPIRIEKVRPRTLAAGIAPEIIKTAREMMERRERFKAACGTQDDSSINARPDSLISEEPERLVRSPSGGDANQDNRLADKNEEDRKKELRRCKYK